MTYTVSGGALKLCSTSTIVIVDTNYNSIFTSTPSAAAAATSSSQFFQSYSELDRIAQK